MSSRRRRTSATSRQVAAGWAVFTAILFIVPAFARAERFCDPSYEDCRTPLLELIRNESVGIDVGFWFMEDTRYATELIRRWQAGVPVRVVMDSRAVTQYGYSTAAPALEMMKNAGIPMRTKRTGGILHFKTMIFAGQNVVEFSAANYSSEAFVPIQPYVNYVDEVIYFSDTAAFVNSFKTRFDDIWTDTAAFSDYANVSSRTRRHPQYPIAPELNFVPWQNFRSRSLAQYRNEGTGIDAIMYRITDRAHSDAMIAAVQRGVPVRLISEPAEYRSVARLWHSWNVDRMYAAGVQVRHRAHAGLLHEKLTLLKGIGLTIFGSSNWTSASAESQHEHNLFTKDPGLFAWSRAHFDRKWANQTGNVETTPFVPLPPDTPVLVSPADTSVNQSTGIRLRWYAGPWAHKYDVYLGTSAGDMARVLADRELGPSEHSTDYIEWTVSGLNPGTTYYWRVVSRTMANLERVSATWTFTTSGAPNTASVATVSVTPNAGSGSSQVFALRYSDSLGSGDLSTTWVWFTPEFGPSSAESCLVYLNVATATVFLLNDAGNTWQPARLGSASTLQNTQCSISLAGTSVSSSGSTFSWNLAMTFRSTYVGEKNVYLYASSRQGAVSGWKDHGDWSVTAGTAASAVSTVSVRPATGSGSSREFSLSFSNDGGTNDLRSVWVWFNHAFTSSSAHSCLAYYTPATRELHLLNDEAMVWHAARVGTASRLSNSQCSIAVSSSTAVANGTTLTLTLVVTFRPSYAGAKNIYLYADNHQGTRSGWKDHGDWVVPASGETVDIVSLSPTSGSGHRQIFSLRVSDSLGADALSTVWVWFNSTFARSSARSCLTYFDRARNLLYLLNDAGTTWQPGQIGTAGTLQNSQCGIALAGSGVTASGNALTLAIDVSFKSAFAGAKNVYAYAAGRSGVITGWEDRADWSVP